MKMCKYEAAQIMQRMIQFIVDYLTTLNVSVFTLNVHRSVQISDVSFVFYLE